MNYDDARQLKPGTRLTLTRGMIFYNSDNRPKERALPKGEPLILNEICLSLDKVGQSFKVRAANDPDAGWFYLPSIAFEAEVDDRQGPGPLGEPMQHGDDGIAYIPGGPPKHTATDEYMQKFRPGGPRPPILTSETEIYTEALQAERETNHQQAEKIKRFKSEFEAVANICFTLLDGRSFPTLEEALAPDVEALRLIRNRVRDLLEGEFPDDS